MNAYTKLRLGLAEKPKGIWVKAAEVQKLTGWDKEGRRKAKKMGWITCIKDKNMGIIYDLQSIPPEIKDLFKQSA